MGVPPDRRRSSEAWTVVGNQTSVRKRIGKLFAPHASAAGGAMDENDGQCGIRRALFRTEEAEAVDLGQVSWNTQSLRVLVSPDHPCADMKRRDEQQKDTASTADERSRPTAFNSCG